jgi:hypothetical protein
MSVVLAIDPGLLGAPMSAVPAIDAGPQAHP